MSRSVNDWHKWFYISLIVIHLLCFIIYLYILMISIIRNRFELVIIRLNVNVTGGPEIIALSVFSKFLLFLTLDRAHFFIKRFAVQFSIRMHQMFCLVM